MSLPTPRPVWKSTSVSGALSHFSVMTGPCWHRRAMRNRHRHAIEQAARRWRGGRREDSARTCRKILISTQAATLVILGMLGLVVNHVFACIWYYLGADDFSEECSTADVPARACTWMQVHGLHPHRTVWNSPPRRVDLISAQAPGQLVPLHHLPVLVSHDAVDCRLRRHIA